eukprot:TRINITY_DN2552_c5_g1_i1.p1 TRINITY_DN2552_c5_g1~~TRINITY_DN2552_c5_g1_i1.p1  ORF type:complete len:482 (+),score=78.54 TRINITY_DN2552_c5_g1_i1:136-1581(+)
MRCLFIVLFALMTVAGGSSPESSRFFKNSELYQVHYAGNFGRLTPKRNMVSGYKEHMGFGTRIEKVPSGWLVVWLHWNPKEDMYHLVIDAFSQDWNRVINGPPKRLCSSKQLTARLATCAPFDGNAMHVFYQLGSEIRHQTVLWSDSDLTIGGGWCGDSDPNSWDNTTHADLPSRTFDILMHASCGFDHRAALVYKVSLTEQHIALLFHNIDASGVLQKVVDSPPLSPLFAYPKIRETGEGMFVIVWEGEGNHQILGRVIDASGEFLGESFTVTVGMANSHYSFPEVVPDRFGGGFVVLWKESPTDEGGQVPRSLIWMREMDSMGSPAEDNQNPHVIFSSYYSSVGLKPTGTATLDGMIWVSFIHESNIQGGLFDFYGTIYEAWDSPFPSDLGFRNITEITQQPHGDLNNGFVIAISGGPTRPISVYSIDRYGLGNSLNSMSVTDYRHYWKDRNQNYTSWYGSLPHDPSLNWNPNNREGSL